ncbi:hypothetical protein EYZ11_008006 [Aspergillus tanneri]|uniref:Uncharacterized protein n=1 Tax=Aspergillus tanneri TaxID=1220188 RepID=A0A4S3JBJ9_9EURO|nr:hypothetical protein EYZ11_008006 [Aspergillus tanneri]
MRLPSYYALKYSIRETLKEVHYRTWDVALRSKHAPWALRPADWARSPILLPSVEYFRQP